MEERIKFRTISERNEFKYSLVYVGFLYLYEIKNLIKSLNIDLENVRYDAIQGGSRFTPNKIPLFFRNQEEFTLFSMSI